MGCGSSSRQVVGCASPRGMTIRGHSYSVHNAVAVPRPQIRAAEFTTLIERQESLGRVGVQRCCFGAGCYWGTEKYMKGLFAYQARHLGAIVSAKVGFMGPTGARPSPNYLEVSTGTTGHVEVLEIWYTGGDAYFEKMVRFFFQFHDPTVLNAQGNDQGTQYASTIFCDCDDQVAIAERVKRELQDLVVHGEVVGFLGDDVTTRIVHYTAFYPAPESHQEYLFKNPTGYCNHHLRFVEWQ